jgi:transaldolase
MKFFIDTADLKEIKEANTMGLVDGVTTNPTLIAKAGRPFKDVILDICKEVRGPVNAEVISLDAEGIIREGKDLAKLHDNVVVKVPMTIEGMKAIRYFASERIKTNVTLVFNPAQALLCAKAGASYISPFVGRLDDISSDGMSMVSQILRIFKNYGYSTEIIVASIRHPIHVMESAEMGAHIATIPFSVMKQLAAHPLTDIGIEKFLKDWEKVPKQ